MSKIQSELKSFQEFIKTPHFLQRNYVHDRFIEDQIFKQANSYLNNFRTSGFKIQEIKIYENLYLPVEFHAWLTPNYVKNPNSTVWKDFTRNIPFNDSEGKSYSFTILIHFR